jgi:transposase InsO family protein
VSLRAEFVALASAAGANRRELCRRFGISPTTGYRWLGRAAAGEELADRSRRPRTSPGRTAAGVEAAVVALRDAHPTWGGRKLAARLRALGRAAAPHPSTVTGILRRHGRLGPPGGAAPGAWTRFERAAPNELWQMDFKGHVALGQGGGRLHPLTVLDDHSRYAVVLDACADERDPTVRARLVAAFRRYGLPDRMVMDNGSCWGSAGGNPWTPFTVWLARLAVGVSHGRPYHPQTQGKDERFHRTLKADVLQGPPFADLADAQRALDRWRGVYNRERPHEALGLATPASRYRPSTRPYPETPPPIAYRPDDAVRRVQAGGAVWFAGRPFRIPDAFRGHDVALRPTATDGVLDVYFLRSWVARVDLTRGPG